MEFSGVRSSCDMLARNSDLYFDVSASSAACSSSAPRACSISWFLRSTSTFCSASSCAFCSNCSLVCCSSRCLVCNSLASCCDCCSRPSVCIVASIEFSTMPMPAVSCSRKEICRSVNEANRSQLDHCLHLAFVQHRQHDHIVRRRPEQAGTDRHHIGWQAGDQHAPAVHRALAEQPLRPCADARDDRRSRHRHRRQAA